MNFNIRRYYYGIVKRRLLALLIFVIPAVFLVVSATLPDRYTVVQNVTISEQSPVALMSNPVGYMPFKELIDDPTSFFLNTYALNKLTGTLMSGWAEKYGPVMDDVIKTSMSMTFSARHTVQISYFGQSRAVGEILVAFYSDRLVKKALEGIVRSNNESPNITPDLSGGIEVFEIRALWRPERLVSLLYFVGASIILVLILFGFLEWNDTSFKSERQIARYIGLPILGNVPDLNKVAELLFSEDTSTV